MPHIRTTFLLIAGGCVALMFIGWIYFQNYLGLAPCPLCMTQRGFIVAAGLMGFAAWLHNPKALGRRIYSGFGFFFAAVGSGVAGRHTWLQSLPADQVPACGPDLSYLFDALPIIEALTVLFRGDGNCADIQWSLLGLSIPGWTLVAFIALGITFAWQFFRKNLPQS